MFKKAALKLFVRRYQLLIIGILGGLSFPLLQLENYPLRVTGTILGLVAVINVIDVLFAVCTSRLYFVDYMALVTIPKKPLAIDMLTDEFVSSMVPNGLILIYDDVNKIRRVGWVKNAKREGAGVIFELGLTVTKTHNETVWEKLDTYTFQVPDLHNYASDGFSGDMGCYPVGPEPQEGLVFRMFPPDMVAEAHNHEALIEYGNAFR